MVDIESLRTVVATGLREYLGCPVIRSNQNANAPKYPYVSYTVITPATENNGTYGEYEDGVSRKAVNSIFSITALSNDNIKSVMLANKAREWLDYVGKEYLNDNGVIVQSVSTVTNRDNVLTSGYEYKNGFDCTFWCFDEIEIAQEKQETIESADVNIEQPQSEEVTAQIKHEGLIVSGDELNVSLVNGGLVIGG